MNCPGQVIARHTHEVRLSGAEKLTKWDFQALRKSKVQLSITIANIKVEDDDDDDVRKEES
jgi:hypothetical protein